MYMYMYVYVYLYIEVLYGCNKEQDPIPEQTVRRPGSRTDGVYDPKLVSGKFFRKGPYC